MNHPTRVKCLCQAKVKAHNGVGSGLPLRLKRVKHVERESRGATRNGPNAVSARD
jgi:hypothetical protein